MQRKQQDDNLERNHKFFEYKDFSIKNSYDNKQVTSKVRFLLILFLCLSLSLLAENLGKMSATTMPLKLSDFNGDFKKLDSTGHPAGWTGFRPDKMSLEKERDLYFVRINSSPREKVTLLKSALLDIPPSVKTISLSVKLRAHGLRIGKKSWENGRVSLCFCDAKGKPIKREKWTSIVLKQDSAEWQSLTAVAKVPDNVSSLYVSAGFINCVGTLDIASIKLTQTLTNRLPVVPPQCDVPCLGREPVEKISSTRACICLNGTWKWQPFTGKKVPEDDAWGWLRVPGSWLKMQVSHLPWISAGSNAKSWERSKDELGALSQAWYERSVKVPEDWRKSRVMLSFARISTDAIVYLDNKEIGRISWPSGELDITPFVKFGKKQNLRVFVSATVKEKESFVIMGVGEGQLEKIKTKLKSKGIVGDVILRSEPQGPKIEDVFVKTSVRKKEIELEIETADVAKDCVASFVATIFDSNGKLAKEFSFNAPLKVGSSQVKITSEWRNPKLWDFLEPNLYFLHLAMNANGEKDEIVQRFGFRELWIEGKDIFLNDRKFRWRPTVVEYWYPMTGMPEVAGGILSGFIKQGFNIAETMDYFKRGQIDFNETWYDVADEMGFPLMGATPSVIPYIMKYKSIGDKWDQKSYTEAVKRAVRKIRNHPSILVYTGNMNYFGHNQDQNPRYIGRKCSGKCWANSIATTTDIWMIKQLAGERSLKILKDVDPTRPSFTHMGGTIFGDLASTDNYLDLIPLQEREEWMHYWAKSTDAIPYVAIEFGTPLDCAFMRGRANGGWGAGGPDKSGGALSSEPFLSEFTAIYLGPKAYELETSGYRDAIIKNFMYGQVYKGFQNNPNILTSPSFQSLQELFIRNTWRSWRTIGMTAGMVPWSIQHLGWKVLSDEKKVIDDFCPGRRGPYFAEVRKTLLSFYSPYGGWNSLPAAKTLAEVNGDTLAWIAGPAKWTGSKPQCKIPSAKKAPGMEAPPSWLGKEHNFFAGAKVSKQAVVINDSSNPLPYEVKWTAWLGLDKLDEGALYGQIGTGETLFLPIEFVLPKKLGSKKLEGRIELSASLVSTHTDVFKFTAFEKPAPLVEKVCVFDPSGKTRKMLEALGCETVSWNESKWNANSDIPIFIGVRAMEDSHCPDLPKLLKKGASVTIMAQDPEWTREKLGLRVSRHVTRRVFPVIAAHPVLSELDQDNLRDWAGESSLIEPYPVTQNLAKESPFGWHWGNRGAVSSGAIEKPHMSAWRPILECEFDLAYSPLMEMVGLPGRVLFCSLDLEDHFRDDPAARLIACNIVKYANTPRGVVKPGRTVLLGEDSGLLDFIGVKYERADRPVLHALNIIGEGVEEKVIKHFLIQGGKVVFLPRRKEGNVLGVQFKNVKKSLGGLDIPSWQETKGLSSSDLRWRVPADAILAVQSKGSETAAGGQLVKKAIGAGFALFCQFDPYRFPADKKTYYRFSRWRQTRSLCQVLGNMGASFKGDMRGLKSEESSPSHISLSGKWKVAITNKLKPAQSIDRAVPYEHVSKNVPGFDTGVWKEINIPSYIPEFYTCDGEAFLVRSVEIPPNLAGKELLLSLGPIDDFDETFWDGVLIGKTGPETQNAYAVHRVYRIPPKQATQGTHTISIRIWDRFGPGGFGGFPDDLFISPSKASVGLYHPDYRDWRRDFKLGDEPYRYKRW